MRVRLKDGRWAPVQKLFEFFEKTSQSHHYLVGLAYKM